MTKKLFNGILILFLTFSSCSTHDDTSSIMIPPNTAAFFGNSLISGFGGYGMAASQFDKDYYNLITTYITTLNESFVATKHVASPFEALTNSTDIDATIESVFLNNLNGNEDLVVIQLGDNVNTPEKKAIFAESSLKLCQSINNKCPDARVVWMGMWYGTTEKYQDIQNACIQTDSKFISFADLISDATRNKIGNLTKKGEALRTLDNVTNVVSNNSTNITVTFTVGSITYSSTLDVFSHSLNSGALTYFSEYEIINNPGVASHPNDEGFRLIANRFLYQLELTVDDEYYK